MKTVVRLQFGSYLYGTLTPQSDLDFKSVHIPDGRDILLQRAAGNVGVKRDKAEGEKNQVGELDEENFSLQRYLQLLAQGQTVAIDMLFAPDWAILESSRIWDHIRFYKDKLLTKRSAAFLGYCRQQANKYGIKGSRVAAARQAAGCFNQLVEVHGPSVKVGEFVKQLEQLEDEHTRIVTKETTDSHFESYFECCNKLVGFKNTVGEASRMFSRIYENYGQRARLAETNEGIDWKALSHAVRVGNEALELLSTGRVTFPLPNRQFILDIKLGRLPYSTVATEIEDLLELIEKAAESSSLRDKADMEFIEETVYDAYLEEVLTPSFG